MPGIARQTLKVYNKHAPDVLAHIVNFYFQYRVRQFVKIIMADLKKANQKKKMARLVAITFAEKSYKIIKFVYKIKNRRLKVE